MAFVGRHICFAAAVVVLQAYNESKSRITFQPVNGDDLVTEISKSFGDAFGQRIEALQVGKQIGFF